MSSTQGAPAPKQNVEQEIGYIGSRLREKSTYGGLAMAVGLALPLLTKLDPHLSGTSVDTIVTGLSYLGMGLGIFIGIFLPEKGSKIVVALLAAGAVLAFALPHPANAAQVLLHRHHRMAAVPVPLADPRLPANATLDAGKPAASAKLTSQQVQQNPLVLLQQFTVNDLNNAIALANAQTPPDTTAVTCWQALIPIVQTAQSSAGGTNAGNPLQLGVATTIQDARDTQSLIANLQSTNGPLAKINNACAPVVVQLQTTLTLLGVGGGVVAAGGPAATASAVAALNALLLALPVPIKLP